MHYKICKFLKENFQNIYIPHLRTQELSEKLSSNVCRNMYTWSHYSFLVKLAYKKPDIFVVPEDYTTKTCGICGNISEIKNSETFKCDYCGVKCDRDHNAARNIFIRNCRLGPLEY